MEEAKPESYPSFWPGEVGMAHTEGQRPGVLGSSSISVPRGHGQGFSFGCGCLLIRRDLDSGFHFNLPYLNRDQLETSVTLLLPTGYLDIQEPHTSPTGGLA